MVKYTDENTLIRFSLNAPPGFQLRNFNRSCSKKKEQRKELIK